MSNEKVGLVSDNDIANYLNNLLVKQAEEARQNQKADKCVTALIELAKSMGYNIAAKASINDEGRIVAFWGVVECQNQQESI